MLYDVVIMLIAAQTEGDTGYDYGDAYEEDFADGDGEVFCYRIGETTYQSSQGIPDSLPI